jgi:hypothetical protein
VTIEAQRLAALTRANEVRSKRRELKADLQAGRVLLADVLFSDADWLQRMRVTQLLLATRGVGPQKARRALRVAGISPTVSLNRTSLKSREILLDWLARNWPKVASGWEKCVEAGEADRG